MSWQESLDQIDPTELGRILSGQKSNHVLPLSFLSLLETVKLLSVSRATNTQFQSDSDNSGYSKKFRNVLFKHVKLKKRHEISVMGELVNKVRIIFVYLFLIICIFTCMITYTHFTSYSM